MARIRSIKPEITESETLAELPLEVCWTFACLWPHCDDRGRRKAQPRLVKSDLYPMRDDVTVDDVTEHLLLLAEADVICLYTGCDGKPYLHVVNWDEHQKVDRPSKSRIPPCRDHEPEGDCARHDGDCESLPLSLAEPSPSPREDASTGSRTMDLVPRTVDLGPQTVDLAPAKPSRGSREPDLVWDALMASCGVDSSTITDSMRGGYNRAVSELRKVGATPGEIKRRAENYQARFPDAAMTPMALAKQWAMCDSGPPLRQVSTSDQRFAANSALVERYRQTEDSA